jgi:hypothetical protein
MKRTAIVAPAIGGALSLAVTLAAIPAAAQLPAGGAESRAVRPNRTLLVAGVVVMAASYLPAVVVAATSGREGDHWLYAPVVGPWLDLSARHGCVSSGGNCDNELLYKDLLVTAGITQLAGAIGIISSLIIPEYRLDRAVGQSVKPEVRVSPIRLAKDGYGVGVAGRF